MTAEKEHGEAGHAAGKGRRGGAVDGKTATDEAMAELQEN